MEVSKRGPSIENTPGQPRHRGNGRRREHPLKNDQEPEESPRTEAISPGEGQIYMGISGYKYSENYVEGVDICGNRKSS